jgi:CheY-like chemotaxis protein
MERSLRILTVEDSADDLFLLERALHKEGLNFISKHVDSMKELIPVLSYFLPDVILCDHALPDLNSVDVLDICRQVWPNVPFILVSGGVSDEFAAVCLSRGVDAYVLKSNLEALAPTVLRLTAPGIEDSEKK